MKERTWEYKDVIIPTGVPPNQILNEVGKDGWELVSVEGETFFFKRPTGEREIPQDR